MIQESRYKKLNVHEIGEGPIVYWMNREIRSKNNWSLLFAQELASKAKQPLIVVYNLVANFLGGNERVLTFKVEGLEVVQKNLKEKNIPFFLIEDKTGDETPEKILSFIKKHKAGALVTDVYPLRLPRKWINTVAKKTEVAMYIVDAHNIVPLWVTSSKKEFGAYTIRPKIWKQLEEYLLPFPALKKQTVSFKGDIPSIDWQKIIPSRERIHLDWIQSGEDEAEKALRYFIKNKLEQYGEDRNDATKDGQSNLSPYLHYGMISAAHIAEKVADYSNHKVHYLLSESKNRAKVAKDTNLTLVDHAGAFLEELIVRRELSDNFCFYEPNYDNPKGFPEWAEKTLKEHAKDSREYIYTKKQFEDAKTHDELWNACQNEMKIRGKMHGYMRMYWAKKILEWTPNVETAMKIAIYLNDTYELDGRDPNGYTGIAWSMGGVHDRAWFPRKIFGTIRYMAESGARKHFDVKKYIEKWTSKKSV